MPKAYAGLEQIFGWLPERVHLEYDPYHVCVYVCYRFMKDKLKPIVKTEEQFLFVCHLVGPFFQRFHIERTRCMLDVSWAERDFMSIYYTLPEHSGIVTLRYRDHIGWNTLKVISWLVSLGCSLFADLNITVLLQSEHPAF